MPNIKDFKFEKKTFKLIHKINFMPVAFSTVNSNRKKKQNKS